MGLCCCWATRRKEVHPWPAFITTNALCLWTKRLLAGYCLISEWIATTVLTPADLETWHMLIYNTMSRTSHIHALISEQVQQDTHGALPGGQRPSVLIKPLLGNNMKNRVLWLCSFGGPVLYQNWNWLRLEYVRQVVKMLMSKVGGRYSTELGIDVDAGDAEVERWFLAVNLFHRHLTIDVLKETLKVSLNRTICPKSVTPLQLCFSFKLPVWGSLLRFEGYHFFSFLVDGFNMASSCTLCLLQHVPQPLFKQLKFLYNPY